MPASDAQIAANRRNSARSTGPKTPEGKEKSRQNAYKHGLTGAGIVLSEADSAEVARRTATFCEELGARGDIGVALARRAAVHSVRMERSVDQQAVAMTVRLRQVASDFVAPEGVDEAEAGELREVGVRVAMFDHSKEATLARQYEAASERGFYKALKDLRLMRQQRETFLKTDDEARMDQALASFSEARKAEQQMDAEFLALFPDFDPAVLERATNSAQFAAIDRRVDVPMTIGRAR
jgi:hypothetical protein